MSDAVIGQPVQRPYCDLNGHAWAIGNDACVVCGQSWDALYEVVWVPNPDGSGHGHVIDRGQVNDEHFA